MTKSKEQSTSAASHIRIACVYLVLLLPGRLWCFLLLRNQHDSRPVLLRSEIFGPTPFKVAEDRHLELIIRLYVGCQQMLLNYWWGKIKECNNEFRREKCTFFLNCLCIAASTSYTLTPRADAAPARAVTWSPMGK